MKFPFMENKRPYTWFATVIRCKNHRKGVTNYKTETKLTNYVNANVPSTPLQLPLGFESEGVNNLSCFYSVHPHSLEYTVQREHGGFLLHRQQFNTSPQLQLTVTESFLKR
jgi:hypothetical protein